MIRLPAATLLSTVLLAGCMAEVDAPAADATAAGPEPAAAAPTADGVAAAAAAPAVAPAPAAPVAVVPAIGTLSPAEVDLGSPAVTAACNLERTHVDADPASVAFSARTGDVVVFDGWILVGGDVRLRLVDIAATQAWEVPVALTLPREDVPRTEGPATGNVGFSQAVALGTLAPGDYRVVLLTNAGGEPLVCDNGRTLTVADR